MIRVRLTATRRIEAPVDQVWGHLVETATWPAWGPTVRGINGPRRIEEGTTGLVSTVIGLKLPFEITELIEGVSWSWKVAGIPATGHGVEATHDGSTVVRFDCPWWAPFYLPVLRRGLTRLDDLVRGT